MPLFCQFFNIDSPLFASYHVATLYVLEYFYIEVPNNNSTMEESLAEQTPGTSFQENRL